MAARKNTTHAQKTREKIQTSQLVNRLIQHALNEDGDIMTNSQVNAACKLINKTLPDLKSIDWDGDLNVNHKGSIGIKIYGKGRGD